MIKKIKQLITVPAMMLLIAVTTLIYSGYRAELNQQNQTARSAGFEVLKALNKLQMTIDAQRYTPEDAPDFLEGWNEVLLIDDMSDFINPKVQTQAQALHQAWQNNFETLQSDASNEAVTATIKRTRASLKQAIYNLH